MASGVRWCEDWLRLACGRHEYRQVLQQIVRNRFLVDGPAVMGHRGRERGVPVGLDSDCAKVSPGNTYRIDRCQILLSSVAPGASPASAHHPVADAHTRPVEV